MCNVVQCADDLHTFFKAPDFCLPDAMDEKLLHRATLKGKPIDKLKVSLITFNLNLMV